MKQDFFASIQRFGPQLIQNFLFSHKNFPARLLFISPVTPNANGTGLEKRANSFILGYAQFTKVDLWYACPEHQIKDPLSVELTAACHTVCPKTPQQLRKAISNTDSKFSDIVSAVDAIHVLKFFDQIDAIKHDHIFWDIDEIPKHMKTSWDSTQDTTPDTTALNRFKQSLNKCNRVYASSKLETWPNPDKINVIPNSVPNPKIEVPKKKNALAPKLLFVGALGQKPNFEGLSHFLKYVFPLIRENLPELRLTVVGRLHEKSPLRQAVLDLQKNEHTDFYFNVPDCSPYYFDACAAIVPLSMGGGTRVKILEAFALYCPVVSTPKGCEGLDVKHKSELLVAETNEAFADFCLQLVRQPKVREQLIPVAHDFYLRNHTQNSVNQRLRQIVKEKT